MGWRRHLSSSVLTVEDVAAWDTDGFIFKRAMFTPDEMKTLLAAVDSDREVFKANALDMDDGESRVSKLTLWNDAGDNTYGAFARGQRWTNVARTLIGEEPCKRERQHLT